METIQGTLKVTKTRQITIPEEVATQLGLKDNSELEYVVSNRKMILTPVKKMSKTSDMR